MIKIHEVVKEIVEKDEIAFLAMKSKILNYSKYARSIRAQVEKVLIKDVSEKTIVVSLVRIASEIAELEVDYNVIKLDNISVHPNLGELCYERNSKNLRLLRELHQTTDSESLFYTITESIGEITIIANNIIIEKINVIFNGIKPIFQHRNLTGITVKFSKEYLEIPNVIYFITQRLAIKDINIIEIVSTTSELTYIIDKSDTEKALVQLGKLV